MKLNEWEKQFPNPGPIPTPPPIEQPAQGTPDELRAWRAGHATYNKWIMANRRFLVARSCDLLEAKQAAGLVATKGDHVKLEAVEMICLVLGVHYLQGDGPSDPVDLFSLFLGRL